MPTQLSLLGEERKATATAVRATSKSAATKTNPQCIRILNLLEFYQGEWVCLPEILKLFIANYRARISELRASGVCIELRDEWADGQRHTAYRLVR